MFTAYWFLPLWFTLRRCSLIPIGICWVILGFSFDSKNQLHLVSLLSYVSKFAIAVSDSLLTGSVSGSQSWHVFPHCFSRLMFGLEPWRLAIKIIPGEKISIDCKQLAFFLTAGLSLHKPLALPKEGKDWQAWFRGNFSPYSAPLGEQKAPT